MSTYINASICDPESIAAPPLKLTDAFKTVDGNSVLYKLQMDARQLLLQFGDHFAPGRNVSISSFQTKSNKPIIVIRVPLESNECAVLNMLCNRVSDFLWSHRDIFFDTTADINRDEFDANCSLPFTVDDSTNEASIFIKVRKTSVSYLMEQSGDKWVRSVLQDLPRKGYFGGALSCTAGAYVNTSKNKTTWGMFLSMNDTYLVSVDAPMPTIAGCRFDTDDIVDAESDLNISYDDCSVASEQSIEPLVRANALPRMPSALKRSQNSVSSQPKKRIRPISSV